MKKLILEDPTKLCEFTAFAAKAYLDEWPDKDKWPVLKKFADTKIGSFCWAACDGKRIVLSFRGTEPKSMADWRTNLRGVSRSCQALNDGSVHGGFLRAYRSLHRAIVGFVAENCKSNDMPIFAVGHSMGGALAELCAAHLDCSENKVYTFTIGAPPLYRADARAVWKEMHAERAVRVVYRNDMVPRLANVIHFSHGSPLVYMDEKGEAHDDKGGLIGWFSRAGYRLRTINFKSTAGFRDHSWRKYLVVSCGAGDLSGISN